MDHRSRAEAAQHRTASRPVSHSSNPCHELQADSPLRRLLARLDRCVRIATPRRVAHVAPFRGLVLGPEKSLCVQRYACDAHTITGQTGPPSPSGPLRPRAGGGFLKVSSGFGFRAPLTALLGGRASAFARSSPL